MRRSRWGSLFSAAGASLLVLALLAGPAEAKSHKRESKATHAQSRELYPDLLQAARRGEWSHANSLARQAKNPLAEAFAEWLYLTDDGTTPPFAELAAFLSAHPDWPGRGTMLTKAEQAIPEDMSAQSVVAWFGDRPPRTGDGALRLGNALILTGNRSAGQAMIRSAWIDKDFTPNAEQRALSEHRALLSGAPTAARIARLLWQRRTSDANRILNFADSESRAVAKARMTLIAKPERVHAVMAGLPAEVRNDSGILFEYARAARKSGDIPAALPIALKANPRTAGDDARWWPERNVLIREALERGLYQDAYRLASENGLSPGADFADAEWLAGWIALRFLDKPGAAADHFTRLYEAVRYPVSKARGAYWAGRALEAAGRLAEAASYYDTAAAFETTYYGQLASQRLEFGHAKLVLRTQPADAAAKSSTLAGSELARAAAIANRTGSETVLRPFFAAMAEAARTPQDYLYAGKLALQFGYPGIAVRVAKKAMQDDIVLTEIAYPTLSVPKSQGGPEPALVLGLSRQESEFDERAVSPAGARGLMQLMPATAKHVAHQEHIQYSPARLEDPTYNMKLGTAYLGDLIDRFNGSYALAVAAYNAGPTNARRWIDQYGDPRDPNVDPIDWVEKIPFSETRNYVQRVLENTQVYRSRLAKAPAPLELHADLARPNAPPSYGKNLIAYLPRDRATKLASATEARQAETKREPARAAVPESAPVVADAAPVPPPAPVQLAEAEPQAVEPVAAPVALPEALPVPKPPKAERASTKSASKDPSTASSPSEPAKSKTPAAAEVAAAPAAPQAPALSDAPAYNPFGQGQPETMGNKSSCTRMILDLSGKPRCADQRASNE